MNLGKNVINKKHYSKFNVQTLLIDLIKILIFENFLRSGGRRNISALMLKYLVGAWSKPLSSQYYEDCRSSPNFLTLTFDPLVPILFDPKCSQRLLPTPLSLVDTFKYVSKCVEIGLFLNTSKTNFLRHESRLFQHTFNSLNRSSTQNMGIDK